MAVYFVLFTLLGLAIASFLNVCIDRLPPKDSDKEGENEKAEPGGSLLSPPSHCPACRRRLAIKDLIPVVSYLWLRGRCRYCGTPIPRRVLWVEIVVGALLPLLYWRYGLTAELAVVAFYGCLFIVIGVIDLEHGLILNKIVYPSLGIALIISIIRQFTPVMPDTVPALVPAAIGSGSGFIPFLLIAIVSKGGMGLGDVKMAALIGLATGFPTIFIVIFIAIMSGGLVAIALLSLKIKKRKEGIPFGPFLSLGAIFGLLWGSNILDWYLGMFG